MITSNDAATTGMGGAGLIWSNGRTETSIGTLRRAERRRRRPADGRHDSLSGRSAGSGPSRTRNRAIGSGRPTGSWRPRVLLDDGVEEESLLKRVRAGVADGVPLQLIVRESGHPDVVDHWFRYAADEDREPLLVGESRKPFDGLRSRCRTFEEVEHQLALGLAVPCPGWRPAGRTVNRARSASTIILTSCVKRHVRRPAERRPRLGRSRRSDDRPPPAARTRDRAARTCRQSSPTWPNATSTSSTHRVTLARRDRRSRRPCPAAASSTSRGRSRRQSPNRACASRLPRRSSFGSPSLIRATPSVTLRVTNSNPRRGDS